MDTANIDIANKTKFVSLTQDIVEDTSINEQTSVLESENTDKTNKITCTAMDPYIEEYHI